MTDQERTQRAARNARARHILWELVIDLAAPIILLIAAGHELLYNHSSLLTWLLVLGLIVPLVVRRRLPLIVFSVDLALVLLLCARGTASVADIAVLVAVYTVAAHRRILIAVLCGVLLEAGVVIVSLRFAPRGSIDDAVVLLTGVAAAALFLGTTLRSKREYLISVEDRAHRLEIEQAQQAQLAALAERSRIAREMHDIVAHGLSVVITLSEGAAATAVADPATARDTMKQVAARGREALAEMRGLLSVLRADDTVDHSPQPTLDTLSALIAEVRQTGLAVEVTSTGDLNGLSDAAQATLYRIVQEALTNVLKHARNPHRVNILLDARAGGVRFSIDDDGEPTRRLAAPAANSGNGLRGMRERVDIFDGSLDAGPESAGWRVSGELRLA